MKRFLLIASLLIPLLAACAVAPPPSAGSAVTSPGARVASIARFAGTYDHGALALAPIGADGRAVQAATDSQLNAMTSGTAGATEPLPNYILLHQTATRSLDGACNASPYGDTGVPSPFQGVCVPSMAVNGYPDYVVNEYVQLSTLTPCGATTSVVAYVKDPSNTLIGVDNTVGLWLFNTFVRPYGDPLGRDRYSRNWFFQTDNAGSAACFRFTAVVMGELQTP